MSEAGFLKALLVEAGTEWKPLGEIGSFVRGNGLQKKDLAEEGLPAIHYGQIYTRYGLEARETYSYVTAELFSKLKTAKANDLLIATTSENDEDVVKPLAWYGSDVAISGDMMFFRHEQNAKYLAHFILTEAFQKQKQKYITGAKVRRVSSRDLAKIEVPIPCPDQPEKSLAIQGEIVRILDSFTELTAELTAGLTAELAARQKQFNYYRDQLLTFEDDEIEWKALSEVAEIGTGSRNTQDAVEGGEFVFYARGREPLKLNCYDFDETAIITAGDGAGVGKVFHFAQGKFALHQRAYRIVPTGTMNPRFLFHCIKSHFYSYIQRASVNSSVTSLRRPMFLKYPVPVPSLPEQVRIVAILDKFETLTTSLTEGLPREIALRQQQYEYYRDLLLSFPKPDEDAEA